MHYVLMLLIGSDPLIQAMMSLIRVRAQARKTHKRNQELHAELTRGVAELYDHKARYELHKAAIQDEYQLNLD